jgi:environmental stress-induced protein Ves
MIKITQEEYRLSNWSGGTTTQLLIWPPFADYQSRNFAFRISSATVEQEESTFTSLPGVHRFLSVLDGTLQLTVKQKCQEQVIFLNENEVYEFEGDWEVRSKGQVRDFNLMLKDCNGSMEQIELKHNDKIICEREFGFLFVVNGDATIRNLNIEEAIKLNEGESVFDHLDQKTEYLIQTQQKCSAFFIQAGELLNA